MLNCDMHTVNALSNGTFELLDQYSLRRTAPPDDSFLGGKYDLREINKTDEGNYIRVYYTRLFKTGDKYDAVLSPVLLFYGLFLFIYFLILLFFYVTNNKMQGSELKILLYIIFK